MIRQAVETPVRFIARKDDLTEFTISFIEIPAHKAGVATLKADQESRGDWKTAQPGDQIYVRIPKAVADFYEVGNVDMPGIRGRNLNG